MEKKFGEFLEQKRKEKGIGLRQMAGALDIAPSYLSDIEKGRRYAPDKQRLDEIADFIGLIESDRTLMYDLAAKTKNAVPADVSGYLQEKDLAVTLLRKVRDLSDDKLKELIDNIDNNK